MQSGHLPSSRLRPKMLKCRLQWRKRNYKRWNQNIWSGKHSGQELFGQRKIFGQKYLVREKYLVNKRDMDGVPNYKRPEPCGLSDSDP